MHYCIYDTLYSEIKHFKSLLYSYINNHQSMGPHIWTIFFIVDLLDYCNHLGVFYYGSLYSENDF